MSTRNAQVLDVKMVMTAIVLLVAGLSYTQLAAEVGENPQPAASQDTVTSDPSLTPEPSTESLTAKVLAVEGAVEYRMSLDDAWKSPLEVNMELPEGAQVRTGLRSIVRLQLGPASEVAVDRLSTVTIGELRTEGNVLRSNIAMQHGKVDFHVRQAGFQNDFKVTTPSGTMAVKGTDGSITTDETTDIDGNNNGDDAIQYTDNSDGDDETFGGDEGFDGDGNGDNENVEFNDESDDNQTETESLHGNESFEQDMNEFNDQLDQENPGGDF